MHEGLSTSNSKFTDDKGIANEFVNIAATISSLTCFEIAQTLLPASMMVVFCIHTDPK